MPERGKPCLCQHTRLRDGLSLGEEYLDGASDSDAPKPVHTRGFSWPPALVLADTLKARVELSRLTSKHLNDAGSAKMLHLDVSDGMALCREEMQHRSASRKEFGDDVR